MTESWQSYAPDVPMAARQPCSVPGCGLPAQIVLVRSRSMPGSSFLPSGDVSFTPYCTDDARIAGWVDQDDSHAAPAHLNAFQQWVVRVLEHDGHHDDHKQRRDRGPLL